MRPESPLPVRRYFTTEAEDRRASSSVGYGPLPSSRPSSRPTSRPNSRPNSRLSSNGGKARSSKELDRYYVVLTPTRTASPVPMPEVRSRPRFSFSGLSFAPGPVPASAPSHDTYLLSQAQAAISGRKNYITAKKGDTLFDDEGCEAGTFRLPKNYELKRVKVADIGGKREQINPRRLNSVLSAIKSGTPLMAVKVDKRNIVDDGFHRLQASKLLGLEYIYVQKPI